MKTPKGKNKNMILSYHFVGGKQNEIYVEVDGDVKNASVREAAKAQLEEPGFLSLEALEIIPDLNMIVFKRNKRVKK